MPHFSGSNSADNPTLTAHDSGQRPYMSPGLNSRSIRVPPLPHRAARRRSGQGQGKSPQGQPQPRLASLRSIVHDAGAGAPRSGPGTIRRPRAATCSLYCPRRRLLWIQGSHETLLFAHSIGHQRRRYTRNPGQRGPSVFLRDSGPRHLLRGIRRSDCGRCLFRI